MRCGSVDPPQTSPKLPPRPTRLTIPRYRFPGLPDDEEARLDSGFLVLTAAEIKDIFEPVVKEVCDLVQGQVDGLRSKGGIVSGIVLVGGFGQSDYLYRRLKSHFTTAEPPPPYTETPTHAAGAGPGSPGGAGANGSIEVMQPVYAWTAVVRGAVLRGLEGNMVISRKARFHYGTSYATVYDEDKHNVSERYWSPLWERWMVSDRMQWHIAKVSFGVSLFVSCFLLDQASFLASFDRLFVAIVFSTMISCFSSSSPADISFTRCTRLLPVLCPPAFPSSP